MTKMSKELVYSGWVNENLLKYADEVRMPDIYRAFCATTYLYLCKFGDPEGDFKTQWFAKQMSQWRTAAETEKKRCEAAKEYTKIMKKLASDNGTD